MSKYQTIGDKFWRDKSGQTVVWQKPNTIIIVWAVVTAIALILSAGPVDKVFTYISYIAIFLWSLLEIFSGVNYFRRLLGVAVLLLALVTFVW